MPTTHAVSPFSLSPPSLTLSLSLGIEAHLAGIYGPLLVQARSDASVSLLLDTAALPGPAAEVIARVAALRKHVVSFPFVRAAEAVAAGRGAAEAPFVFRLRPREPVYILTRADRVAVIYHLEVPESTDRAMARVVAQELTEAYRAVNHAPPCSWSEREAPQELKGFPGGIAPMGDSCIGYLTFTIFPSSYKTAAQREAVAAQLALFRDYLMYHLKAAKTYLHARMRSRSEALQKVLNRAIPDVPEADKEKKTSSGRRWLGGGGGAGGGSAAAAGGSS